jgi:hypothetical protein
MRKANNPKTKITITLELEDCTKCPMVKSKRTQGAGYALDYFCTAKKNERIMGYIEWPSEYRPVPEWCPHKM